MFVGFDTLQLLYICEHNWQEPKIPVPVSISSLISLELLVCSKNTLLSLLHYKVGRYQAPVFFNFSF